VLTRRPCSDHDDIEFLHHTLLSFPFERLVSSHPLSVTPTGDKKFRRPADPVCNA
jgi:hypothetical protein